VTAGAPYREDTIAIPGYSIGESIGAGGFGEVFRARHELMGRDVAIKVLQRRYSSDPDAVARFIAEARAASRIKHPGIVEVFDFGMLGDGRHYCVMELIHGTTLREFMRTRERLPLAEALPILRGIAEAVDAAHAAGIAHRDLKPDNVFLVDGAIKLIDFGLAKLISDEAPMTATGAVFGTPHYMSPEQCRGRASDPRTDVYTFGILAYQLLTGEMPFTGDALELALQHLNDPPEPPSTICAELPPHVDRVMLALLAKDPEDRPTPLVRMVDALAGDAPAPPRPRRKWPVAYVAIGGALVVAAGGVWLATRDRSEPTCPSGEARLADVWDLSVKHAPALDAYAASWIDAWNAACRSPDPDPLIAAQRAGCLDDARVELGGIAQALDVVEPDALQLPSLTDCSKPALLRAHVHSSPGDGRHAMELLAKAQRTHAKLRAMVAAGQNPLDDAANQSGVLLEVAFDLKSIYPHGANTIRRDRAAYLSYARAADEVQRSFFHQAIDSAITFARESRDDDALAADLALLAEFELAAGNLAKADAALADGVAALERSGTPELPARWLARARAAVEAARKPVESTGCPAPRDPNARGRFTVFVNTEGVTLVRGTVDDARIDQSEILKTPSLTITPMLDGVATRTTFIADVIAHARRVLAPYSIDIVTRRPDRGDYMMIATGGGDLGQFGGRPGMSATPFHCKPIPRGIDVIWASPEGPAIMYANFIASDVATMFGLTATTTKGDCMCRFGDACDQGPSVKLCTFGVVPTITFANCDRTTQDEPAMLRELIGCR
jgi:hypothetical protein